MGLDVYTYIVIGVPAKNYITYGDKIVEKQRIDGFTKEPIYRRDGTPFLYTETKCWYTYKGKEYLHYYDIEDFKGEYETKFNRIDLYTFGDGEDFYDQDTIGLLVCRTSQQGGKPHEIDIEELYNKFVLAKSLLENIGIVEIPKIRLVMYWSN